MVYVHTSNKIYSSFLFSPQLEGASEHRLVKQKKRRTNTVVLIRLAVMGIAQLNFGQHGTSIFQTYR